MPDRVFFPLVATLAVAMIALSFVLPKGQPHAAAATPAAAAKAK